MVTILAREPSPSPLPNLALSWAIHPEQGRPSRTASKAAASVTLWGLKCPFPFQDKWPLHSASRACPYLDCLLLPLTVLYAALQAKTHVHKVWTHM